MGPCTEGTDRNWFIYKIMSQDMSTNMSYWVEQFGVSILNQGSKVQEVWWQVSISTHPGDHAWTIGAPGDDSHLSWRIPTTPVSRGIRTPLKVVRADQLIDPPDHNMPFEMIPLKLIVDRKHRLLMLNICNVDEYFLNTLADIHHLERSLLVLGPPI